MSPSRIFATPYYYSHTLYNDFFHYLWTILHYSFTLLLLFIYCFTILILYYTRYFIIFTILYTYSPYIIPYYLFVFLFHIYILLHTLIYTWFIASDYCSLHNLPIHYTVILLYMYGIPLYTTRILFHIVGILLLFRCLETLTWNTCYLFETWDILIGYLDTCLVG
jgi:hypothetical protein